jgi:hypothetical protein
MTDVPYGFCECGCGERTKLAPQTSTRYGWTQGQPQRFINGHNRRSKPTLEGRFWARVDKSGDCWVWTGGRRGRYGAFWVEGQQMGAHRFAYELLVGPIPDGLTLDHLCCNPPCVNPGHLEPVTFRENGLRVWRRRHAS